MACYMDLFALSWTQGHDGVERFALAVFDAGTAMMPGQAVDAKTLLPCATTVRGKVLEIEAEERKKDKEFRLKDALSIGGAMSCDGLKQKHTGAKVYDLTLHYFHTGNTRLWNTAAGPAGGSSHSRKSMKNLRLITRTIFVSPLPPNSGESALAIRSLLNSMCLQHTGIPFAHFQDRFSLVSDCAKNMPNIVGRSVSENVAPLDYSWVGCIPHQMNTVMKTVFSKERLKAEQLHGVWTNLEAMREIVRVFKQSGWNSELPSGKSLISEVDTRFGQIHSTCSRFIHSATDIYLFIEKKSSPSAKSYWRKLDSEVGVAQTSIVLPTLQAVVDVCKPMVEIMVQMQGSKYPTIHVVAPRLLHATKVMARISVGAEIRNSSGTARLPSATTMGLAKLMMEVVKEKVLCHPIYVGSILLHPLLATFSWVDNESTRSEYFKAAEKYVRDVMEKTTSSPSVPSSATSPAQNVSRDVNDVFSLDDYFAADCASAAHVEPDELQSYISKINDRSLLSTDEENILRSDKNMGMVNYWYNNDKYPRLRAVALRRFATPASSCESERVFSAVNKIQSKDRSRLDPNVQSALIYLRSLHLAGKDPKN